MYRAKMEIMLPEADCHLIKRALLACEDECGDNGFILNKEEECFFALIDGLGHGGPAHHAAQLAENYLEANHDLDLKHIMLGLHDALGGSRGAVASLCRLHTGDGKMEYIGVGNITVRVFGIENVRLTMSDGIIGYSLPTLRKHVFQLTPGDVVMLYSDGIREHFEEYDCPGLLVGSAEDISKRAFECFYKGEDDGSCLVVRYG